MIRHPLPSPSHEIPPDHIRKCAYYLWLAAGRPDGRDLEFWLSARERLRHAPEYRHLQAGREVAGRRARQKVRTTGQDARSSSGGMPLS